MILVIVLQSYEKVYLPAGKARFLISVKADKKNWGKAGMPTYYGNPEFDGSVMLALEKYDKAGKIEMKMETKEITENFKHSVSTVGYSFIKMNFGQAGKK